MKLKIIFGMALVAQVSFLLGGATETIKEINETVESLKQKIDAVSQDTIEEVSKKVAEINQKASTILSSSTESSKELKDIKAKESSINKDLDKVKTSLTDLTKSFSQAVESRKAQTEILSVKMEELENLFNDNYTGTVSESSVQGLLKKQ